MSDWQFFTWFVIAAIPVISVFGIIFSIKWIYETRGNLHGVYLLTFFLFTLFLGLATIGIFSN